MQYPIDWTKDGAIRACFTYQTKHLAGPRFGVLPISWYQRDHADIHDNIVGRAKTLGVTGVFAVIFTDGRLWAKISGGRISLGSATTFNRAIDR
jgi:hypothetical protein